MSNKNTTENLSEPIIACGQTTVPTVDNSQEGCTEFVDANCVILGATLPLFGITADDSLLQAFTKMNNLILSQSSKIQKLEQQINSLI